MPLKLIHKCALSAGNGRLFRFAYALLAGDVERIIKRQLDVMLSFKRRHWITNVAPLVGCNGSCRSNGSLHDRTLSQIYHPVGGLQNLIGGVQRIRKNAPRILASKTECLCILCRPRPLFCELLSAPLPSNLLRVGILKCLLIELLSNVIATSNRVLKLIRCTSRLLKQPKPSGIVIGLLLREALHDGRIAIENCPLELCNAGITGLLGQTRIDSWNLAGRCHLGRIATKSAKRIRRDLLLTAVEERRQKRLCSAISCSETVHQSLACRTSTSADGRVAKAAPFALISRKRLYGALCRTRQHGAGIARWHNRTC